MAQNLALATSSDRLRAAASAEEPMHFRQAPHNIDAEQALLGAILVNNEAMDRVSSFLEPHHFFDPLHQQIFETAAKLIHAGKNATPITLRTFFERAESISPNLTVPQYLGTLAANATTIINAEDYGRTVYDLATRRALIIIGEDMVTGAYDSPVDFTPQAQIQEAEMRLGALSKAAPSALTALPLSKFLELQIQARPATVRARNDLRLARDRKDVFRLGSGIRNCVRRSVFEVASATTEESALH